MPKVKRFTTYEEWQQAEALKLKILELDTFEIRCQVLQLRFLASLTDSQMAYIRRQAKQRVNGALKPQQQSIKDLFPHYEVEKEQLLAEWMDRTARGKTVPSLNANEETAPF